MALIISALDSPGWDIFTIGEDPGDSVRGTMLIEFFGPRLSTVNPVLKGPCIRFFLGTNEKWIRVHKMEFE